jgi:DHA1 family tetracycline resistance protein-like MFS transporter
VAADAAHFLPVQGSLADHFGRRPVLLISCTGPGLDFILMALAPNLWWLLLGRVISGITAASFSTAGAYIADITPAADRAAKFSLIGAAFGMGFVLGPALGGVLSHLAAVAVLGVCRHGHGECGLGRVRAAGIVAQRAPGCFHVEKR